MRRLVVCIAFLVLTLSVSPVAFAQVRPWWNSAWAYACPQRSRGATDSVFPRYEYRNRRLVLVDILTGQVMKEVETSLSSSRVDFLDWSPDCRYLVGTVDSRSGDKTIVWDVTASSRVAEFSGGYYAQAFWNPNGRYLVTDTRSGGYLFDTVTSKTILLSPPVDRSAYSNHHPFDFVRWDNLRNQVIAVQVNGDVVAYDIAAGSVVSYFPGYRYGQPDFRLSPDHTKIAVFSHSGGIYFSIWDRDTGEETWLRLPKYQVIHIYSWEQIAVSPDNRYVAVGAPGTLCIWDLLSLPVERSERFPKQYPYSLFPGTVQFVSDEILEIHGDEGQVQRWNVRTGEVISS